MYGIVVPVAVQSRMGVHQSLTTSWAELKGIEATMSIRGRRRMKRRRVWTVEKDTLPRPNGRSDVAQGAINQINVVLLRDGTAAFGPSAVTDYVCVDLWVGRSAQADT